ncbi:glycogen debranching enzyme [Candidatus Saccharibacteria bacterium]|nr:glycogen debranching enzyme [Candidatus Saccharibacteria bacterium]
MASVVGLETGYSDGELSSRREQCDRFGPFVEAEPCLFDGKFGLESIIEDGEHIGYTFAVRTGQDVNNLDFCFIPNDAEGIDHDVRWSLYPVEHTPDGGTIWTARLIGLMPGDRYGLRVDRESDAEGYGTLLLDPYAKVITRDGHPDSPTSPAYSVATEQLPTRAINRPSIDPKDRVIYEAHIIDATMLNPEIPEELRGKFAGFAHPANIRHLKELGITTVELLPIMQFFSEAHLVDNGKTNHWGYNTAGFFAPHEQYAIGEGHDAAIKECQDMIDALHDAGIEVILDVVYNHTADSEMGSHTYCLRGLDNEGYYRMFTDQNGNRNYWDSTGCGNTIDTSKPAANQLIYDSLLHWYEEMGVDGFRFDLAGALTKYNPDFFKNLSADEKLKECQFITEPWFMDPDNPYPRGTMGVEGEWDGAYRDFMREFWNPENRKDLGTFAMYFMNPGFINFITAHDGFTLKDLTSYSSKHNEENGEDNRDGANDNRSNNHGVEGHTDDPEILERREQTAKNLLLTLMLSIGTPMVLDGDDRLHSQGGNNNPYCQNNEITWRRWDISEREKSMQNFLKTIIELRKRSGRGSENLNMGDIVGSPIGEKGIDWFNVWGSNQTEAEWKTGVPVLGIYSSGHAGLTDGESLLYYVNGTSRTHQVSLPKELGAAGDYEIVADTKTGQADIDGLGRSANIISIEAMSSFVMRRISSRLPATDTAERANSLSIPNLMFPSRNFITINHPSQRIIHSSDELVVQEARPEVANGLPVAA